MMSEFLPLKNLRVLDLSRYLPGPYLGSLLHGLGARVVKIEEPGGEPMRSMPPQRDGFSAVFTVLNAGKQSVCIDLKKEAGVQLFLALCQKADIVLESFRPGVMERLGLGYQVLKEQNPKLIVCAVSGYGATGPMRSRPGHDLNFMARSGVLSVLLAAHAAEGSLPFPPLQWADIVGGSLHGAMAILASLYERSQTEVGRFLDISMTRSVASVMPMEYMSTVNY